MTGSRYALETPFVKVREDTCVLPNGKRIEFYTVELKNWATVVAFSDKNEIILVKQYRHSTGETLIELPAGELKKDEDPQTAIKREFMEETGFALEQIEPLGTWYTTSGKSDCEVTAYSGRIGKKIGEQELDAEEQIEILRKPASEVIQMIRNGTIQTAPYIAAIFAAKEKYPKRFD